MGTRNDQRCTIDGCDLQPRAIGLCSKHYRQHWNAERHRKLLETSRPAPLPMPPLPLGRPKIEGACAVAGCDAPLSARGFCKHHYM